MKRLLLSIIILIVFQSCHQCKRDCGYVTTKVWSHITGACYVIVTSMDEPSEQLYLNLDTARFDEVNIGDLYCGTVFGDSNQP